MAKEQISWDYWRTFVAIFDCGSLTEAARALSITQPTAGRHIGIIEDALGISLFSRSREGLMPTEHALKLIADARAMQSAAYSLSRRATSLNEDIKGTVRISASEIVGTQVLPPILSSLQTELPQIVCELVLSNAQDDLLGRDVDLVVRLTRPAQQQLLASKAGVLRLGLFAHQTYLETSPPPTSPEELSDHRLIGFDRDPGQWSSVRIGSDAATSLHRSFRCDSDLGQLAALKAGAGIGVCPLIVAMKDKGLVAILPNIISVEYEVWLAMHEDLKRDLTVHKTMTYLASALRGILK
jgi:DNA-binding transcriptional LysR family regulator